MHYYSAIIFFSVFLMVFLLMMLCENNLLTQNGKRNMFAAALIVIVASLMEWSGEMLNGTSPSLRPLHIAAKMIELSIAPILPVLCASMIREIRRKKWLTVFLGIHAAVEVLSAFFGFVYYVDADNIYCHGPLYGIYIAAYLVGILLFIGSVLQGGIHHYGTNRLLFVMAAIYSCCGISIQYVTENIRVDWLCASISLLLVYVLHIKVILQTDAVTHLFNRVIYENRLPHIKKPVVIMIFDIDNFKHINDMYGHAYGDSALLTVGKTMQTVYGKVGRCYRIGGDEFCTILNIPEQKAEEMIDAFLGTMRAEQAKDDRLPEVSVGYAYFDPAHKSIEDSVREADEMMYQCKRAKKAQG